MTSGQVLNALTDRWHLLGKGLSFCEIEAPEKSFVNDSHLFILRADPSICDFELLCSSEHGKKNRPADQWANEFGMEVTVNAGMFSLSNGRTNKGYLKNYSHFNNSKRNGGYNVLMALNPKKESDADLKFYDLTYCSFDSLKGVYHTICQGMRMIDGNGNKMAWDKHPDQKCSMVVGATDLSGTIYFIFARSPYTAQQMIGFLMNIIPDIRTTVYLEGGPEASLYIHTNDTTICKYGSYVSKSYPNDRNDHLWKLPNVIGIKAD